MKIQDLRHIRLTETYFEDLPDEERIRLRSQNQAELRRLSKRDYPFKLKNGTEVLGPVIRFEPYKSDAGRDETWKDANQQMVERPNGERAIMFAVGLGLITKTPPRKPLNWPGMLGLKEAVQDLGEFKPYGSTNGYVVDTDDENNYKRWLIIYGRDPRVQEFIQTVKRFAILDSIEVQKDARGMRYGNQLIKSFISDAKAAGAEAIIAAVNKTEIQAKGFDLIEWYQKLGFKMIDNRGNVSVMALRLIQDLREREDHPYLLAVEKLKTQHPKVFSGVYLSLRENQPEARGGIWIDSIDASGAGERKGYGTRLLKMLVELADRMRVPLALEAEVEEDEEGDDDWWRLSYFERFGFAQTGDWGSYGAVMFRNPL